MEPSEIKLIAKVLGELAEILSTICKDADTTSQSSYHYPFYQPPAKKAKWYIETAARLFKERSEELMKEVKGHEYEIG